MVKNVNKWTMKFYESIYRITCDGNSLATNSNPINFLGYFITITANNDFIDGRVQLYIK